MPVDFNVNEPVGDAREPAGGDGGAASPPSSTPKAHPPFRGPAGAPPARSLEAGSDVPDRSRTRFRAVGSGRDESLRADASRAPETPSVANVGAGLPVTGRAVELLQGPYDGPVTPEHIDRAAQSLLACHGDLVPGRFAGVARLIAVLGDEQFDSYTSELNDAFNMGFTKEQLRGMEGVTLRGKQAIQLDGRLVKILLRSRLTNRLTSTPLHEMLHLASAESFQAAMQGLRKILNLSVSPEEGGIEYFNAEMTSAEFRAAANTDLPFAAHAAQADAYLQADGKSWERVVVREIGRDAAREAVLVGNAGALDSIVHAYERSSRNPRSFGGFGRGPNNLPS